MCSSFQAPPVRFLKLYRSLGLRSLYWRWLQAIKFAFVYHFFHMWYVPNPLRFLYVQNLDLTRLWSHFLRPCKPIFISQFFILKRGKNRELTSTSSKALPLISFCELTTAEIITVFEMVWEPRSKTLVQWTRQTFTVAFAVCNVTNTMAIRISQGLGVVEATFPDDMHSPFVMIMLAVDRRVYWGRR